jgi:hypothetical protein
MELDESDEQWMDFDDFDDRGHRQNYDAVIDICR